MVTAKGLKKLREGRVADAEKLYGPGVKAELAGRRQFVLELREQLGLMERDEDGVLVESLDDRGNPVIAKGALSPYEFSLKDLAVAIGGHEFHESFEPGEGN